MSPWKRSVAGRAAILLLVGALAQAGCDRPASASPAVFQAAQAASGPALGTFRVIFPELEEHGLAVILRTPSGRTYLVDAGRRGQGYDAGRDTLEPMLRSYGITHLDGILLSHPDRDHYGGAPYLVSNFSVKEVLDAGYGAPDLNPKYTSLRALLKDRSIPYRVVREGDRLSWDDALEVEVLAPPRDGLLPSPTPGLSPPTNDNSIVLRIRHGKIVFLLPGDIQRAGRNSLLERYGPDRLKATILAAPHHGFSHGRRFANVVHPEVVVVSAQAEYSSKKTVSPGQDMTEFFGPIGSHVYVTSWHGNVEISSDGSSYQVKTQREPKE